MTALDAETCLGIPTRDVVRIVTFAGKPCLTSHQGGVVPPHSIKRSIHP
ncbi:hypothetical protein ACFL1X_02045 [Candidatus Hydrogenedentota bacterium]